MERNNSLKKIRILAGVMLFTLLLLSACGNEPHVATKSSREQKDAAETTHASAGTKAEADTKAEAAATEAKANTTAAEAATETTQASPGTEEAASDAVFAPELELYDQFGNFHRLSDYRGKVVFLNFWATWCPPCRSEMPDIQALYEKYADGEEVVILGVCMPDYGGEESEEGIKSFMDENGYSYPTLMDHNGTSVLPYYITAYPTTFMIDRAGYVYGYVQGAMSADVMQNIIDQTLSGGK